MSCAASTHEKDDERTLLVEPAPSSEADQSSMSSSETEATATAQPAAREGSPQTSSPSQNPQPVRPAGSPVPPASMQPSVMVPTAAPGQPVFMMAPANQPRLLVGGHPGQVQRMQIIPQAGPVQYMPTTFPQSGMPTAVQQPPRLALAPNDYFVMTLVLMIVCAVMQVTSLIFGIPALVCSMLAREAKLKFNYPKAKTLGVTAVFLMGVCLFHTIAVNCTIIGFTIGLTSPYYYY